MKNPSTIPSISPKKHNPAVYVAAAALLLASAASFVALRKAPEVAGDDTRAQIEAVLGGMGELKNCLLRMNCLKLIQLLI